MSKKDQLLLYLKQNKGTWISGESLSHKMLITRSAIWKHIRKLKDEGYIIESFPRKGYLLHKVSESLLGPEIQDGLNTRVFGKGDIIHSQVTASTNAKAREMAAQYAPEGTLIISEKQTDGRGRRGRSWFSPQQEGIYVSLILRPRISPADASKIMTLTSLAIAETIHSATRLRVTIKWPNDIMVDGRKIAGILTEISTEMDVIDYLVVGIGLNVNIPYEGFPDEIREKSTSVLIETGKEFSRINLIRGYLQKFENYYELLNTDQFGLIMKKWREFENVIGRKVRIDLINKKYTGDVIDIDEDGALIVRDNYGKEQKIFSGDILFLSD